MCHNLNLNLKEASYTMGTSIELDSFQISLQNWFIENDYSIFRKKERGMIAFSFRGDRPKRRYQQFLNFR